MSWKTGSLAPRGLKLFLQEGFSPSTKPAPVHAGELQAHRRAGGEQRLDDLLQLGKAGDQLAHTRIELANRYLPDLDPPGGRR